MLEVADAEALRDEIARATAAGDMLASSDPAAAFVMKTFAIDPEQFGGAFLDGALAGFVSPNLKIAIVRPDLRRRGIGRSLVDLGLEMERGKGRPELILGARPGDQVATAFLEATGFGYHSSVFELELPSEYRVVAPAWPSGHAGRSFERSRDLEAWVAVFNDAFADHPTPLQLEPRMIEASLADPDVHDADIVIVEELATGELVGFCAVDPGRREGVVADHAELWAIGVRPDRQGRGLGRQLVRAGIERVRSLGIRDVGIAVNARNAGTVRLYESEGFVRTRTRDRWSRPTGVASETTP